MSTYNVFVFFLKFPTKFKNLVIYSSQFRIFIHSLCFLFILSYEINKIMASSSKSSIKSTFSFPSPTSGPFQCTTLARVTEIEESMIDVLQMLTEIQVTQLRMAKEQERQGKILRNLQKFLMNNYANPILIDEDSSLNQEQEAGKEEEEEEPMEEAHEEGDDQVVCVGEVCFDKNGNLVEQRGNLCFHYPNCSIHRSPMFRNTH